MRRMWPATSVETCSQSTEILINQSSCIVMNQKNRKVTPGWPYPDPRARFWWQNSRISCTTKLNQPEHEKTVCCYSKHKQTSFHTRLSTGKIKKSRWGLHIRSYTSKINTQNRENPTISLSRKSSQPRFAKVALLYSRPITSPVQHLNYHGKIKNMCQSHRFPVSASKIAAPNRENPMIPARQLNPPAKTHQSHPFVC